MLMKNPHLVWAGALCVLVVTAGSVVLALFDKDPNIIRDVIVSAAIPLLGMFGFTLWKEVREVKENTNGINNSFQSRLDEKDRKLEEMQREKDKKIEELQRELKDMALLQLPPPPQDV